MSESSRVKVKICGITSVEDALAVAESGADFIGLNFYPRSPRYVRPEQAREILKGLPPEVVSVGVFVNSQEEEIKKIVDETGLDYLQFHGDESPEFCQRFLKVVIKAIRLDENTDLSSFSRYDVFGFLVDSATPAFGGSGITCDWNRAREASRLGKVFLAGGINPDNVAEAIEQVQPYGVDVCSGVETSPGKKDISKVEAFIKEVKGRK